MYGFGILKGLFVTARRFLETYLDDIKWFGKRYYSPGGIRHRMSSDAKGIFTVQYPEEKIPVPEEFRFVPFLVFEEGENGEKNYRCTSCGICARVCPPQCIWIVRRIDKKLGRPIPPDPVEFYIDVDICMNCGLCAEFCPFDAIKMDHDYELAVYDRHALNIYNMEKLGKPVSYYAKIRPINSSKEKDLRLNAKRKVEVN
jgi:NADH-quinone oxidoreductase subunit I